MSVRETSIDLRDENLSLEMEQGSLGMEDINGDLEQITAAVLEVMAEKTGYPAEIIEPDLDLEADLGIDSVKQGEIFVLLGERYGLAEDQEVKIKDLNTMAKIVAYFESRLRSKGE